MVGNHMNSGATMRYSNFRKDESSVDCFFFGQSNMKVCSKCGNEKFLSDFHAEKRGLHGVRSICKECDSARQKLYRDAHKEEAKIVRAKYILENAEKISIKNKEHKSKNKEKNKILRGIWKLKNPEKVTKHKRDSNARHRITISKKIKDWHKNNPNASQIYRQNRRTVLLKGDGKLSKGIFAKLFELQKGRCITCHEDLSKTAPKSPIDHVIPLSKGGLNIDSNVQLLCKTCNLRKNAKDPLKFMQEMGFLC